MTICSLLPSSTEILFALGLGDDVVAVTHECDYPPAARGRPVITGSVLDRKDLPGAEIDARSREQLHGAGSIYHLDTALLHRLAPDLIITQALCEVCAVAYPLVEEAALGLERPARVLALEPTTLDEVWRSIEEVGEATGRLAAARACAELLRRRVARVAERAASAPSRPRVLCLEWIDPPFGPGQWLPEMVELAGGSGGLGEVGKPSRRLAWAEVEVFRPDVIVIMPCGFGLERGRQELARASLPEFWPALPAVRQGRLHVVDGNAYFNRPGPRLAESLELLAHLIHPELFAAPTAAPEDEYVTITP
ncbi:MAG: cobalamin-binding protein [Candidatus Tectomicrobia bacterium]|nr:cobalamin-binding protein [Candidatus Tectomicrobia bacterium]